MALRPCVSLRDSTCHGGGAAAARVHVRLQRFSGAGGGPCHPREFFRARGRRSRALDIEAIAFFLLGRSRQCCQLYAC